MTEKALKSGINFIDTSPWYGQGLSEKRIGVALKNIPRDKYFIATKVSKPHKTAKQLGKHSGYFGIKNCNRYRHLVIEIQHFRIRNKNNIETFAHF